jgi:hypothetical protein
MHISRRAGLAGVLTIAALTLAACGGGTATTNPDGTPAPTAAPDGVTPAPTTAPDPNATTPAIDLPSFDPSALLENLEGIDSYRVTVSTDGELGYQAAVVTKPVLARDILLGADDDAQRIVVIGDEAWSGTGDELVAMPSELATGMLAAFDPMLLFGGFAQAGAWQGAADQGTEERNGVQARHFRIDDGSFLGAVGGMPDGASVDAWIAEDGGYLVGLEILDGEGSGYIVDVTDVNDPSITVERPG